MSPVLLTSAYLPPVQYFTKLYAASTIYLETYDHYVKQTYRNRAVIATAAGPLALTLPVEHDGTTKPLTRDVRLSDHGNWRHLHWTALTSAYERSPYFFYYADDFRAVYERPYRFLVDFNEALISLVLSLLNLTPHIVPTTSYADAAELGATDLRETIRPKLPYADDAAFSPAPYYQVFSTRHGFLPNLSIADLLFNMGLESRLVLRRSLR